MKESDQVHFEGETPRESDWGCQSIPWPLYTIIKYIHVCIRSTNTVKAGIVEINNMMWPHGSGRMEEKYEHEGKACVWQHSHAQHGNELVKNKVRFNETRFTMRQTRVCEVVKGMR